MNAERTKRLAAGDAKEARKKLIVGIGGVTIILGVTVWLLVYFQILVLSKPEPGPDPASYIEQLPKPDQERIKRETQKQMEMIESGEQQKETTGQ